MSDTGIGELLESAVPPLPERPDRIAEIRARVRRARLAAVGAATGAVACGVALAIGVPVLLTGADRAAPVPAGPGENLVCPPAVDRNETWELPDRPTEPQGGPMVPDGAVAAMMCEREVIAPGDGLDGEVIYAPVLTTGLDEVVDALNLPPVEHGGPSNICYEDAREPWAPASLTRWLVLEYPDGGTITVAWDDWCGNWSTGGQVRFRDEVSHVFYQLYAVEAGLNPPPSGAPPFTEPPNVEVGKTYRLTIYTHCGVDVVSFDGRIWRTEEDGSGAGNFNYATADVTYVDHDTLRLTLVDGLGAGRVFVLHPVDDYPACD